MSPGGGSRRATEPRAQVRVARVITLVTAVAAVLLGVTAAPDIIEGAECLVPAYTVGAVLVIFGGMLALAIATLILDLRGIRIAHASYAVAFLLVQGIWPFALLEPMPASLDPWVVELTALGTVPAAIAWRPWIAWTYLGVASVIVGPVRFITNGGLDWAVPLQYVLLTPTLAGLFTALALAAMGNARAIDAATEELRDAAARSAASRARIVEGTRLDALVHDQVMSTLFYASRDEPSLRESVRTQARAALHDLERLATGRVDDADGIPTDVFVSRIRAAVLDVSIDIEFDARAQRTAPVPSEVASAFAEATSEAARNSLEHAGARAVRRVTVVAESGGIEVRVYDTGIGFDARTVEPHRLGILVSIRGRFAAIPRGSASVTSYPGAGTLVVLSWRDA